MKTKALIALTALLAAGALTHSQPASAHSKAMCKFEVFDTCEASGLPHSWCVAAAEQQCAGHSHGGSGTVKPGSSDYTSAPDPGLIILNKKTMKLRRN